MRILWGIAEFEIVFLFVGSGGIYCQKLRFYFAAVNLPRTLLLLLLCVQMSECVKICATNFMTFSDAGML